MSGEFGFAYVSDKVGDTGATTTGMSQTDGSITIAASEDLGGGLKLMASHTIDAKGRSAVSAENSTLVLAGGFGSVLMGSLEAGNGILGLGGAGGVGRGLDDGTALDGGANVDLIKYTTPALISGLTANVSRADSVTSVGAGRGGLQTTGFGVDYSAGPLVASFDSTSYNYAAVVAATQVNKRTRLSASYDLGVVKVGAGYQKKTYMLTGKPNKQTVIGVSAPFGAFTVSLAMSGNKTDGSTKVKGTDLGVNYAMSKRTSLNLSLKSVKDSAAGSKADKGTRLRLKHTF